MVCIESFTAIQYGNKSARSKNQYLLSITFPKTILKEEDDGGGGGGGGRKTYGSYKSYKSYKTYKSQHVTTKRMISMISMIPSTVEEEEEEEGKYTVHMRGTHLENRREFHRKPKIFIFHVI